MRYSFLSLQRLLRSHKTTSFFRFAFSVLIFAFIAYFFFSSRHTLALLLTQIDSRLLALCVLGWSSLHFVSPAFSHRILKGLGSGARLVDIYTTYWNRLPAKYLPGGIWQTVARVSDLKLSGLPILSLTSLVFYEVVIPPLFTAFVGGTLTCISSSNIVVARYGEIIALIVAPILLAAPHIFFYLLIKKIKIVPLFCYFQSLAILGVFWLIAGLIFCAYLRAFNINNALIQVVGAYMTSWTLGYITVLAPQGVGVAEVSLTQLLNLPTSFAASVAIFAGFRVIIFCADFLVWLSYHAFKRGVRIAARF